MPYNRRDFVKILFTAAPAVVAGVYLGDRVFAQTPTPAKGSLNFLVVGDWGRGTPDQIEVAAQMARSSSDLGAKFLLNVGDNFYEDGVTSVDDPQWITKFENIYQAPSLQLPWYSLLGNHDYHGNVPAQLEYATKSKRWLMPARYYTFKQTLGDGTTVEFFCLDTSIFVKQYLEDNPKKKNLGANVRAQQAEVPKQLAWLDQGLAASKADWKIVVGHHPIYSAAPPRDQQDLIDAVLPILVKNDVRVYFNGHDHNLQHLQAGKINFFDSGAGSHHHEIVPNDKARFAQDTSGYASASLTRNQLQISLISNTGKTLYTTSVARI